MSEQLNEAVKAKVFESHPEARTSLSPSTLAAILAAVEQIIPVLVALLHASSPPPTK